MSSSYQSDDYIRRARIRWRARRGILENDLIFERFFRRYEHILSAADVSALTQLLELSDSELMDLLLSRSELNAPFATPDVVRILSWLRAV
ncbi:succinate dehydrogenase assembly factor 2 [Candidatus Vallotia cooleyia]|uniref:FAD assembly factor SdhE n=1 Tax=Candidatus Vallotiella adelgis TaxID=1177211 RepID=UPI001D02DCB3|nr:succinate dehydrogenase assembly factor 2 [Candidatus Vallotia cooleyia]UDG82363.1 succinate dehydrogenase assembly factor 2 [Candidatus Vallotia cooleyia]